MVEDEEDKKGGLSVIKKYRSEWKYILTNQELSLLNQRLSQVMEIDSHTPPGRKIFNSFVIF